MKPINDWDEPIYRDIAKKSGSAQAVADVKFARMIFSRENVANIHFRHGEDGMILAWETSISVRIICVAVDTELQGKGIGGDLLKLVENLAQKRGCKRSYTVTKDGKRFYEKYGYSVIERRENGWVMEKKLG